MFQLKLTDPQGPPARTCDRITITPFDPAHTLAIGKALSDVPPRAYNQGPRPVVGAPPAGGEQRAGLPSHVEKLGQLAA